MDSVGDWERETPWIDKFFTYSLKWNNNYRE